MGRRRDHVSKEGILECRQGTTSKENTAYIEQKNHCLELGRRIAFALLSVHHRIGTPLAHAQRIVAENAREHRDALRADRVVGRAAMREAVCSRVLPAARKGMSERNKKKRTCPVFMIGVVLTGGRRVKCETRKLTAMSSQLNLAAMCSRIRGFIMCV